MTEVQSAASKTHANRHGPGGGDDLTPVFSALASFQMQNGRLNYDDTGTHVDQGAAIQVLRKITTPTAGVKFALWGLFSGVGDNATFNGVGGVVGIAADTSTVTSANKGVLYGAQGVVQPHVDRNNSPFDDVVGLLSENQGTAKGTDGIYIGRNRADLSTNPTAQDWGQGIQNDAWTDTFIRSNGHHTDGIVLSGATITGSAIKLGTQQAIAGLKVDGTTLRALLQLDASDNLELYAGRVAVINGGGLLFAPVTAIPGAPASGSVAFYSDAGVLKQITSDGTITPVIDPNLLTNAQYRPLTSSAGWVTGTNTSIAASTKGLAMTAVASGTTHAGTNPTNGTPVTASTVYYAKAVCLTAVTAQTISLSIDWYDSSNSFINTSTAVTGTDSVTAPLILRLAATSPSNAAFAVVDVRGTTTQATGEVHYVNDIVLAPYATAAV